MNLEIFLNESSLINEIKQWLSVFDKHNLYKFLHPSHFYNIVSYLKTVCIQNDDEEECLINEMNMLSINNKDSNVSEYLSKQIDNLNLINYIQWKLFDKERCVNIFIACAYAK